LLPGSQDHGVEHFAECGLSLGVGQVGPRCSQCAWSLPAKIDLLGETRPLVVDLGSKRFRESHELRESYLVALAESLNVGEIMAPAFAQPGCN